MREILFKAKSENIDGTFDWIEGYLSKCDGKWTICDDEGCGCFVEEDTICQYTGLTDMYGAKIWENDICNCAYDGRFATRVIVWDESELDFKGTNGKDNYGKEFDYLGCCEEIEVIGNIFDNAELLEG